MKKTRLAKDGGPKAVKQLGPFPDKIGKPELLEVMDLWKMSPKSRQRIKKIIAEDAKLKGPHLFRYYNPRPSKVAKAEELFSRFIGVPYALAVNSCTSALVSAIRALGIGMGDEVIVPAYTFFATTSTVGACNAIPVIADVDDTLSLDPKDVERKITPRTKAIIVVHMRGVPAQMDAIMRIAHKHKIAVIEDVAQAAGGSYKGKMLGSIGTIGCFSFDYYKVINSGEGGFVTTNDEWLYTRAQSWHDCAACWRPDRYGKERAEGELFCGENYRMSELQGAVAVAQLKQARKFLRGYRRAKARILKALKLPDGVTLQRVPDPEGDASTSLVLFLKSAEQSQWAFEAMRAEGVPAGGIYDETVKDWHIYVHWEHILEQKTVAPDGLPWSGVKKADRPKYTKDMCPKTTDYLSRAIMINMNWAYTAANCKSIAAGINKVLAAL